MDSWALPQATVKAGLRPHCSETDRNDDGRLGQVENPRQSRGLTTIRIHIVSRVQCPLRPPDFSSS
jgi:hypothetical protein